MNNINELINRLHEACQTEGVPLLVIAMPEKQHMMMLKHTPKPEMPSPQDITPELVSVFSSSIIIDMAHERIIRLINGERSKHEEQGFEIIKALGIGLREVGKPDEIH